MQKLYGYHCANPHIARFIDGTDSSLSKQIKELIFVVDNRSCCKVQWTCSLTVDMCDLLVRPDTASSCCRRVSSSSTISDLPVLR
jgi:hypothetical protein